MSTGTEETSCDGTTVTATAIVNAATDDNSRKATVGDGVELPEMGEQSVLSNKKRKAMPLPLSSRVVSQGVEGTTASKIISSEDRELVRRNNAFFALLLRFYPSSIFIFEGVLVEFLKSTGSSLFYRSVFEVFCRESGQRLENRLKRVCTVELWERVTHYVQALAQYKEAGGPIPAIFTKSDLPSLRLHQQLLPEDSSSDTLAVVHTDGKGNTVLDRISLQDLSGQTNAIPMALARSVNSAGSPNGNTASSAETKDVALPTTIELEGKVANDVSWDILHVAKLPESFKTGEKNANSSTAVLVSENGVQGQTSFSANTWTTSSISAKTSVDATAAKAVNKKKRSRLPDEREGRQYLDGEPTEKDVKYGRGGGTNNHIGNIHYLLEKLKLQAGYTLLSTQRGKKAISKMLVDRVTREWGGRFVAKDDVVGLWYVVDGITARKKASQTLREDKTPYDQASKRKTLLRKLSELQAAKKERKAFLSVQEHKASQTLLELNASRAGRSESDEEKA